MTIATAVMFALAALTFLALTRIDAPYGRHARPGWGPVVSARLGWVLMEAPASLVFAGVHLAGPHALEPGPLLLAALWQLHYAWRAFGYPFTLPAGARPMPLSIAAMGLGFNLFNASLNAWQVSAVGDYSGWLGDPRLYLGGAVFLGGMWINRWADAGLRRLRDGGGGYRVPQGGLYRWVSCPNYLGEIVEWLGWALATWSLAGLGFAVYTFANLGPRAMAHHRWYRATFPDYPPERRALVPGLI